MTREQTIEALRPYFRVSELVCQHTFARFGEQSWQFLDTDLLRVLLYPTTKLQPQQFQITAR